MLSKNKYRAGEKHLEFVVVAGLPFKIGGQVNFTEKATFDATLGESKRIITQLLGKSFLSKKNSLSSGFEEERGDSASGAGDEVGTQITLGLVDHLKALAFTLDKRGTV